MTVPEPQVLADPQRFSVWLARYVSTRSCRCEQVIFRIDGGLVLVMRTAVARTRVVWRLFEPAAAGRPFRGGSLEGSDPAAVAQVERRLAELFAQTPLPLLTPSPTQSEPLRLSAEAVGQRLGALLPLGEPICGPFCYSGCQQTEPERPTLTFVGADQPLTFTLAPRGFYVGQPILADIGPLSLAVHRIPEDPVARRLAGLLGFVLRLCVAEQARLELPAGEQGADAERGLSMLQESYDDEIAVFDAIGASAKVGLVGSMERECLHCLSDLDVSGPKPRTSPLTSTALPGFADGLRFVDPTERDVIMHSTEEALLPLLQAVAERDAPDVLVVMDSCTSRIKGDAAEQVVQEHAADLPVPVIYLDGSVAELHNYPQFWRQLLHLFVQPMPASAEPSVNLIGFGSPGSPAVQELTALLSAVGIEVNLSLLPSFDTATLGRFDRAWVDVLCPARQVRDGYRDVPPRADAQVLGPPAPCGLRQCRAWLDTIRAACRLPPLSDGRYEALWQERAPAWEQLRERARQVGIGIVFERVDLVGGAPRLRWGRPWLEALEDMGFPLSFLLHDPRSGAAEPFELERLLPFLQRPTAHRQVRLRSFDDLAAEPFALVYTERFRDTRVTRAGKLPVSTADLELGVEGACRSLERISRRGAISFHRDHAPRIQRRPP